MLRLVLRILVDKVFLKKYIMYIPQWRFYMSTIEKDVNKVIENLPRLVEAKRRIRAYIQKNGTLNGFDDKSVKLVKPL